MLDEPTSNLDGEGDAALVSTVARERKRGGIVVVISYRQNIPCKVWRAVGRYVGRRAAAAASVEVAAR